MDAFDTYMANIKAKRDAFNKEMTEKLLDFLREEYGHFSVREGYVYLTLPDTLTLDQFLTSIVPYIAHNKIEVLHGRVGISLRFC